MVYLTVRKCFRVSKVSVLVVLVITILVLVEKWRGGRRSARAQDIDPLDSEYERLVREDEARIIPGLGDGGAAAQLTGRDKQIGVESEKKYAINVYLSDRIAYNRSLEDHRNPACQRIVYDAELPSASVIIIFHNEPYSVVVRTLWSVVNSVRRDKPWFQKTNFVDRDTGRTMNIGYPGQDPSSPFVYLKEIILVDDNSTLPELKGKLSHYVRTRMPADLIRILRLPDRVGLTRARLAGARYASGDVLLFLDAHCEVQPDWMRPLLQRLRDSNHAVVMPIIDVIGSSTLYYSVNDPFWFQVGGFTFSGHFTWIDVPEREKKRRGSDIAATWSPTMAGGLFAINREYYWELGAYDEQMAGWGGENLEMSFRIWQCGGTLETIPCSRVGHVFRSFHPYGMPASSDTHGINTARMAEVWMDDYKELFYLHRPDLRKNPRIGDVTHRKVLREKLQCKSFEWYLTHIYKEKFVPVRDALGYGRFRCLATGLCLDTLQREADGAPLGVYPCHDTLQGTQYLSLALDGQLRDEERCVELQYIRQANTDDNGRRLLMVTCSKNKHRQKWRYTTSKQLLHVASGLCVDSGLEGGADVFAKPCANNAATQRWDIDYSERNDFMLDGAEPNEAELTLQKLRGQRRISRSLLSYSEDSTNSTVRRHTHKKRKHRKRGRHGKVKRSRTKIKNKFILKLVRTLMNNTEEHLEVDIHCKHKQLYPNNSFVRDLVTILNEKNIKVINNGRVFERNRVTELEKDPQTLRQKESKVLEKLEVEQRVPPSPPVEPPAPPPAPETPSPPKQPLPPPSSITGGRWMKKHKKMMRPQQLGNSKNNNNNNNNNMIPLGSSVIAPVAPLPVNPSPPDQEYNMEGDPMIDKKIIIEDFVEVKQISSTPDPFKPRAHHQSKKRRRPKMIQTIPVVGTPERILRVRPEDEPVFAEKPEPRKRLQLPTAPTVPQGPPQEYLDESMRLDSTMPQNSLEEVPVISGEQTQDLAAKRHTYSSGELYAESSDTELDRESDQEAKYNGEIRQNYNRRKLVQASGAKDDLEVVGSDKDGAEKRPYPSPTFPPQLRARNRNDTRGRTPLKLIMKSNLTFNLGEEFFKWTTTDDVANILGSLAIPPTSPPRAPPLSAWQRPPRRPRVSDVSPPSPSPATTPHAHTSEESSSSSESSDNDR